MEEFKAPCHNCDKFKKELIDISIPGMDTVQTYNFHRECIGSAETVCLFKNYDVCDNWKCPNISYAMADWLPGTTSRYAWCKVAHNCGACHVPDHMQHERHISAMFEKGDCHSWCPGPESDDFYVMCDECKERGEAGANCDECTCRDEGCCEGCPEMDD